jgi:hypothetical protein
MGLKNLSDEEFKRLEIRYRALRGAALIRVFIKTWDKGEKSRYYETDADFGKNGGFSFGFSFLPEYTFECTPILFVAGTEIPLLDARELIDAAVEDGDYVIRFKTVRALNHVRVNLE